MADFVAGFIFMMVVGGVIITFTESKWECDVGGFAMTGRASEKDGRVTFGNLTIPGPTPDFVFPVDKCRKLP